VYKINTYYIFRSSFDKLSFYVEF